jgi:hypothetical protein
MHLRVDDLVLADAAGQSEADTPGKEHQTVPTGRSEGHLLDFSASYDDPILLENESKGVPAGDGYLIHPNEFTNPRLVARARANNRHIGPWNQPLSEGCQITRGTRPFEKLRDEISRLGFPTSRGSTFTRAGRLINRPEAIKVEVKNK